VTDDFPAFQFPKWIAAVAMRSPVLVERVDSNGLLPMHSVDRVFNTAHSFRRFLQANLRSHLTEFPVRDPLLNVELPLMSAPSILKQGWPPVGPGNASVSPVPAFTGGAHAARETLRRFVTEALPKYSEARNQPESDASSGLSPYLHFGHISTHEIFSVISERERWSMDKLHGKADGGRAGWWGMSADAEAFLDQLVTWRELGFNMCAHGTDPFAYSSLPEWVRKTLGEHAGDPRPVQYSLEQFESASTHDALWNAAQLQLVTEGRIHNYLRMLWGKKILEWSRTPEVALDIMIHLNNKYALDGRDPNSYTGIFWVLGRYDRPWAPVRPIFGSIRYMSSENTARKLRVRHYVERYTGSAVRSS
jgi:deoxyribodipyrimidine photo-lyase